MTYTLVNKDKHCDELIRENFDFKETNQVLSNKINIFNEQLGRLQTSEENIFEECKLLQSQLEIGSEEKARLAKVRINIRFIP